MNIISTSKGFVLGFKNKKDMEKHIENLEGQLEWIKEENVDAPYLYCVFDDRISRIEIEEMLSVLKEGEITD